MPQICLAIASPSDAAGLIAANLDSRAHHAPWAHPFTDQVGFDAWFAGQGGTGVGLVAREVASGGVVGVFNITQIVQGSFQSAYLGYYGMAAHARRGLMTEAMRLTIGHAFDALGLHRLEANIQPGNLASIALARRTGFKLEGFSPRYLKIGGQWRDHERWAILADAEP
jgi:ribosomal-protein-alanine N-acetyltransferase